MNDKIELIQTVIFDNYEVIREELIDSYNQYYRTYSSNEGIYLPTITKNYVDKVKNYVIQFVVVSNNNVDLETLNIYVEDKFTFDNIQRIIEIDGNI